jgi:hypothetical protein
MKTLHTAAIVFAVASVSTPGLAQKPKAIGKCMRPDCASMQQYCNESKSEGKTGTDCAAAGKLCLDVKGRTWLGTTPDGKRWSCTF